MDTLEPHSPRDFLRDARFSPEEAHREFPNARRILSNGLFISHSGADAARIRQDILIPVVQARVPGDAAFLHSGKSGGADSYKRLVQAALHWCDKFMVVLSKNSIGNVWVVAEVEWAIKTGRTILAVSFDSCGWQEFLRRNGIECNAQTRVWTLHLEADAIYAQQRLTELIDLLLAECPMRAGEPSV